MSLDAPADPAKSRSKPPRQTKPLDEVLSTDAADLLAALNALCAGDFGVRLEPRGGVMGQVVARSTSGSTPLPRSTSGAPASWSAPAASSAARAA